MRIRRVIGGLSAVVLASAVAGCSGTGEALSEMKLSKTADLFTIKVADSTVLPAEDARFGHGPVPPEQLVDPSGHCVAETQPGGTDGAVGGVEATASPAGAPVAVQSADPGQLPLLGGVGLGMTECQVVRRAGAPGNVAISADPGGDRVTVLTYVTGALPGVYRFSSGRLKVIEKAPEPPKPEKPVRKRAKPKPKTATR
ncbi:MAG: hypothetical protein AB7T86_13385 [Xanthobacteraceae bacterium]